MSNSLPPSGDEKQPPFPKPKDLVEVPLERDEARMQHVDSRILAAFRESQMDEMKAASSRGGLGLLVAAGAGGLFGAAVHAVFYPIERYLLRSGARSFTGHMTNTTGFWMAGLGAATGYVAENITQQLSRDHSVVGKADDILAERGERVVRVPSPGGNWSIAVVPSGSKAAQVTAVEHQGKAIESDGKQVG